MGNSISQDVADRNLQIAAECVFDIGNHIIAEKGFPLPDDNEDIISILQDNHVISDNLSKKLKGLGGFRNILVHNYLGIDYNKIYEFLSKKLGVFEEFASEITAYMERD